MNWHIWPSGTTAASKWELYKDGSKRVVEKHALRRNVIKAARARAGDKDVIYVHNNTGFVVIRIPELPAKEKVAAKVIIHGAGDWTPQGRKEVAAWLRDTAQDLVKLGKKYAKTYTARRLYT